VHGAAKNTPFFGESFEGQVQVTIVNGSIVFDRGEGK
jgi:dihydroorotase-like cyclic amidohydrolase